jgi:signal transduction histidine kinase/CheY-like chemotaxis protein
MNEGEQMATTRDEHEANLRDVQEEALRLLVGGTIAAGFFLLLLALQVYELVNVGILGISLMFMTVSLQWLLSRFYLLRAWLLTASWLLSVLILAVTLPLSNIVCLLALPVGLAAFAIGDRAGLLAAVVGTAATLALAAAQTAPIAWSALAVIWGVFALFWLSSRPLLVAMRWSWQSYAQAHEQLEEARLRQAELNQMARLTDLLAAARRAAEEAERARAEFAANVSHELRTPLNMILGFAEMIVEAPRTYGAKLPPALLADVAAIQRNSQHLANLINDVLDISQIEAQRMTLTREWNTLSDIVEGAVLAVRPLFESRGLFLQVQMPADLPRISCDRTRIRQVLLNLLNNAARFTDKGGVTITAEQHEQDVVVTVTDSGPGIRPEDIAKLFEPFRQLDGTTTRRQGGSGLGLNISRRFVELHGGEMGVRSQPGKGSSFWFSLPLSSPSMDMSMAARFLRAPYEVRTHSAMTPKPQFVPRVVILETHDMLQSATRRYLDGVEVVGAASLDDARALLAEAPAQAILIRGESPEQASAWMDGLHETPNMTPVAAVTLPSTQTAGGANVAGYLTKPITRAQIFQAIAGLGIAVNSVLLTDDDPEALQLFSRILSSGQQRYRVLQAASGQEALSLLRERRPDLLLLDLLMPGMDGLAVLAEKDHDPLIKNIPVLILSAQDPSGQPIVAPSLTISRSGGLSLVDLLRSAMAISEILAVSRPAPAPTPQAKPGV